MSYRMVLKTLDVVGKLHGYGISRRIEQISGDLFSVNQARFIASIARFFELKAKDLA